MTTTQLSNDVLEIRKKGIGGSDAAKVAGCSNFGTALDVYNDKLGLSPPKKDNIHMMRGRALESTVLEQYQATTGNKIITKLDTVFSQTHPFMLATLDAITEDNQIIVEAKTARCRKDWGESGSCDIPVDYLLQVVHYCAVYDVDVAHVFVLFDMPRLFDLFVYERDERLETALIKKEEQFWNNFIIPNVPPPITALREARIAYAKTDNTLKAIIDSASFSKFKKYIDNTKDIKRLESEQESLKIDLMLAMGGAAILQDAFGINVATWKGVETNRFDSVSFKKSHPDLYKKFVKTTHTRRFLPNYKYMETQNE